MFGTPAEQKAAAASQNRRSRADSQIKLATTADGTVKWVVDYWKLESVPGIDTHTLVDGQPASIAHLPERRPQRSKL